MLSNLLNDRAPTNEKGEVEYSSIVRQINWRDYPVPPMPSQPIQTDDNWQGTVAKNQVNIINYNALLEALLGRAVSSQ